MLNFETVALEGNELVILDQTKLPGSVEILRLTDIRDIWNAIYTLQVRGAPAIGIAAAFGLYLASLKIDTDDYAAFIEKLREAKDYLNSARPTAVNLSWALNRLEKIALVNNSKTVPEIRELL
ncbi:MAG: hypothetical protein IJG30_06560, partial [Synergistaceae bacterium]|nr:hypothetical protein [Synergistaceae bacterium]